ncbi:hypothetical protein ACN4EG_09105 [Alkalinema pantanalense CENA528]
MSQFDEDVQRWRKSYGYRAQAFTKALQISLPKDDHVPASIKRYEKSC